MQYPDVSLLPPPPLLLLILPMMMLLLLCNCYNDATDAADAIQNPIFLLFYYYFLGSGVLAYYIFFLFRFSTFVVYVGSSIVCIYLYDCKKTFSGMHISRNSFSFNTKNAFVHRTYDTISNHTYDTLCSYTYNCLTDTLFHVIRHIYDISILC